MTWNDGRDLAAPRRLDFWRDLLLGFAVAALTPAQGSGEAAAQTAWEHRGPPGVKPLAVEEPVARLIVEPPVPEALADGRIVVPYRAESLRIALVFGPVAVAVTPRVGHIHVTADDLPWHWAVASGEPIIVVCFASGPDRVRIDVVDANHRALDSQLVEFTVP